MLGVWGFGYHPAVEPVGEMMAHLLNFEGATMTFWSYSPSWANGPCNWAGKGTLHNIAIKHMELEHFTILKAL